MAGTRGLVDVISHDDIGSGLYTKFAIIYIPCILSDLNNLFLRDLYIEEFLCPWRCVEWCKISILSSVVSNLFSIV